MDRTEPVRPQSDQAKLSGSANDLPAYLKIRSTLAAQISAGELRPGDRLPTERALCETFGVARATVRQALLHLEGDGLIRSTQRGKRGWFVNPPPLRYDPTNHLNSSRNAKRQGRHAEFIILQRCEVEADESMRRIIRTRTGAKLWKIASHTVHDGVAVCVEQNYLLAASFPKFLELAYTPPLTQFLEAHYQFFPTQIGFQARAARLSEEEASILDVAAATPCIRIVRVKADQNGRVVQVDREAWVASAIEIVTGDVLTD